MTPYENHSLALLSVITSGIALQLAKPLPMAPEVLQERHAQTAWRRQTKEREVKMTEIDVTVYRASAGKVVVNGKVTAGVSPAHQGILAQLTIKATGVAAVLVDGEPMSWMEFLEWQNTLMTGGFVIELK